MSRAESFEPSKEIIQVLEQYGIYNSEVQQVRSAYKVICDQGIYCLKKLKHGKAKSIKGDAIVRHLKRRGFPYVVDYLRTTEGELYVELPHRTYYMTDWVDGKEVNFKSLDNLVKAVKLLAMFHVSTAGFEDNQERMIKEYFAKRKSEYDEVVEELMRFKESILSSENSTLWEKKYAHHMGFPLTMADLSMKLFQRYNYDLIINKDKKLAGFCHESYYYQNVIEDNNKKYYLIDLDSCVQNIFIYDLGKLLRRMLWAKEYRWNFDVVRTCIENYKAIKPLEKTELGVLLGIIIFPHKYWKLGGKWFERKEGWTEEMYDRKLKKQIECIPEIQKFIDQYSNYYGINING